VRGTDHVIDPDGRLREPLYKHDVDVRGGTLEAVRQRDADSMARMKDPPSTSYLQDVGRILDTACAHGTRVILFFSPIHARQLESIEQMGKWQESIDWKKSELDLVNSKPDCDIELWDFARHSKVTEEPVPKFGPMKYYWESSHYKKATGDAVLTISVGRQKDPQVWQKEFGSDFDAAFGEQLSEANFADSMQRENAAREAWRQANPDIIKDVAAQRGAQGGGE
jgi:hypothetical protein